MFMMPCRKSGDKLTKWFKTDEGKEGQESSSFDCKRKFVVEMKHSGNYNNTRLKKKNHLFKTLKIFYHSTLYQNKVNKMFYANLILNMFTLCLNDVICCIFVLLLAAYF